MKKPDYKNEMDKLLKEFEADKTIHMTTENRQYIDLLVEYGYLKGAQAHNYERTLKGHIFYLEGGFRGERRRKLIKQIFQHLFWIVSVVALSISVFIAMKTNKLNTKLGNQDPIINVYIVDSLDLRRHKTLIDSDR